MDHLGSMERRFWKDVRKASGIAAAAVLVYMAFLSVREGITLDTEVMIAMLALIIVLIYGVDSLEALIRAWRNGNG